MRLLKVASFVGALVAVTWSVPSCTRADVPLKEVSRVHSGMLDVVVLAPGDAIKQGKGSFEIEFRDASGALADAGMVNINASMPMPGMAPMFGTLTVLPDTTRGRYHVSSDLGMAGTWRFAITW